MKNAILRKFLLLLLPFLLFGCVVAEKKHPYYDQIDKTATASAPWAVGAVVSNGVTEFGEAHRKFLGITKEGSYLVQDFYSIGSKLSDPYKVKDEEAVKKSVDIGFSLKNNNPLSLYSSAYVGYTPEGNKFIEYGIFNGKPHGPFGMWLYNAHKLYEGEFKDGEEVGTWREWDKAGQLIGEQTKVWNEKRSLFEGSSKVWGKDGNLVEEIMLEWEKEGSMTDVMPDQTLQ